MSNQCHMLTCRYNINAKCTSEKDYKVCTDAVIGVLGKEKYESFLEWEKSEITKKKARKAIRTN